MIPFTEIDKADDHGGIMRLYQRGEEWSIRVDRQGELMNSRAHNSEDVLAEMACALIAGRRSPRLLVGGLGMGFTLRAVLDELPASAAVTVAELNSTVVDWCRGPLATLTGGAVDDPRVTVAIGDVAELVRRVARDPGLPRFDAIVFDLYKGPHHRSDSLRDPLYGSRAIAAVHAALAPQGVFTVWGENFEAGFDRRLQAGGFATSHERPGRGGYRHVVFIARKQPASRSGRSRR